MSFIQLNQSIFKTLTELFITFKSYRMIHAMFPVTYNHYRYATGFIRNSTSEFWTQMDITNGWLRTSFSKFISSSLIFNFFLGLSSISNNLLFTFKILLISCLRLTGAPNIFPGSVVENIVPRFGD